MFKFHFGHFCLRLGHFLLQDSCNMTTRKLTAEGQRFSFQRVLTSSMHIPFCPTHIPFCPTHWCWHLVCTFHSVPPLVLTSSVHLGWTTRFWHKILQHILSKCITDSSLQKLITMAISCKQEAWELVLAHFSGFPHFWTDKIPWYFHAFSRCFQENSGYISNKNGSVTGRGGLS